LSLLLPMCSLGMMWCIAAVAMAYGYGSLEYSVRVNSVQLFDFEEVEASEFEDSGGSGLERAIIS
jgi:hypothetical protein